MNRDTALVVAGTCLIAGTYGLVRLAYGLFLPDIQASLAMGPATAGYVSSGASAVYCLGAFAGLVAADRPRWLVVGAWGTASAGATGMALAPGLEVFVPSAIVASAGAGLASPGMVAVVARNLPAARANRAQAIVNSGTGPGLVVAGLMALVLLPQWRLGFAVSAAVTAAAGVAVLLADRRPRDSTPRDPMSARGRSGPARTGRRWLVSLRRPAVGAVLLGSSVATVWTYGRALLVDAGASSPASVVAWTALGLGGTATVLTARALTALPAQRAWLLTTAVVALATATLGVAPGSPIAVVACAVFGWAFVAATSALIVWATQSVPDHAAAGTSALFIALTAGQAVGSSAAGSVAEHAGLPDTFLLAAVVTTAAASCGAGTRP